MENFFNRIYPVLLPHQALQWSVWSFFPQDLHKSVSHIQKQVPWFIWIYFIQGENVKMFTVYVWRRERTGLCTLSISSVYTEQESRDKTNKKKKNPFNHLSYQFLYPWMQYSNIVRMTKTCSTAWKAYGNVQWFKVSCRLCAFSLSRNTCIKADQSRLLEIDLLWLCIAFFSHWFAKPVSYINIWNC